VKSLRRHQQDWEALGRVDPLWAVLTSPSRRHGRWDTAESFATGTRDIAALMETARTLGIPQRRDNALDFGCGVGRLTRALAGHFAQCVGVDISAPMLARAEELNRECERCRFVLNTSDDLSKFEPGSFDLVYSKYVLQHLPGRAVVRAYVSEFMRVLRPGGLLVFQLPSKIGLLHRLQPRRRLYALLRRLGFDERMLLERLELTPMRMGFMAEAAVTRMIAELGGTVVRVERLSPVEHTYFVSR
jgi:ubiquinone/menaquinone biosynthesis C-methylase UbiE